MYNYLKIKGYYKKPSHICYYSEEMKERGGKESKSKIGRMKLKPLGSTQLDITSYLAAPAGNAHLVHKVGRDERRVVRITFQR